MIACISIPYFAAAVERRGDRSLSHLPLAIGGKPWEARPVYAFSQELARQGVKSGMSLRLVQLLSPQSHFMPATEAQYRQASGEVIDVLTDFSCLIEPQELWHSPADPPQFFARNGRTLPARYCLDLEGVPFRESVAFISEMGKSVRRETELAPAIGLASNKFTAQVAATVCRPNHALPVSPGEGAQFLAPRPVDFLPLDKESARRLHLLGIRTLGQLATLPSSAVHTQFGLEMQSFYHLARGQVDDPVRSQPAERREEIVHDFDAPIGDARVIMAVLRHISAELARRLQAAAWEGRELHLGLEMDDGAWQQHTRTLRHPTANAQRLHAVLKELYAQATFTCGLVGLSVVTAGIQPATARQLPLFGETAGPPHHLRPTIENMAAKYKASQFYRPVLAERAHPLPERRFQLPTLMEGGALPPGQWMQLPP